MNPFDDDHERSSKDTRLNRPSSKLATTRTTLFKTFDLVIVAACFMFAAVESTDMLASLSFTEFMGMRITLANAMLFVGFLGVWHIIFSSFRLYDDSATLTRSREALEIVKATSIGVCIIVAVSVIVDISFVNAKFLLILWTSTILLSIALRQIVHSLRRRVAKWKSNEHRVLIVGVNDRSQKLARQIEMTPERGMVVVGFVGEGMGPHGEVTPDGKPIVASAQSFLDYLGKTAIDEVLICMAPRSRFEDIAVYITACDEQGVTVGILRDLFPWKPDYSRMLQLGDQMLVNIYPHSIIGARATLKRWFDILMTSALLLFLSPLFLAVMLAIKVSSPGPVFFSQERIGMNKKRFRMLKFRSMVVDAEARQAALESLNEADGPAFKIKNDPRITSIGAFLRRTSLDELPQLINVLRGDMSLVGPRPLPIRDYEGFRDDRHRRRLSVRPGMTGLWQVYSRDHSAFEEWMALDLQYIDQWSLALDLKVMLRTLPAVLRGAGD